MQYVGLDVHKTSCQACVEDENGNVLLEEKIPSTKEELNRFFSDFDEAEVVLESTVLWEYVYETIEEMGFKVVLAHPLKAGISYAHTGLYLQYDPIPFELILPS